MQMFYLKLKFRSDANWGDKNSAVHLIFIIHVKQPLNRIRNVYLNIIIINT